MTTGYVYDPIFLEHDLRGHPENRERLRRVIQFLRERGLAEQMTCLTAVAISRELLELNHTRRYIERVAALADEGGGFLDMDTYVAPRSFEAALFAAGGTVAATEAVLEGSVDNAICLVRPPGHHALPGRGMGFCIFNNVAVAARAVMAQGPVERIAIIDFDVHHGNGTEASFYRDPSVLYCSTHQYPHYPGTGSWTEIGEGEGKGATVNVPLPAGVGDKGFRRVFDEILWPAVERFEPDLLMVSAGYDGHWADPLASLQLSLKGYAWISRTLVEMARTLCKGRLVVALEGGYDLEVLSNGVANTCRALLGLDEEGDTDPKGPSPYAETDISRLLESLRELHDL